MVVLAGTYAFGTELELSTLRDPFEFGKDAAFRDGESEGRGNAGRLISRLGMVVQAGGRMIAYIDGVPRNKGDVVDGARITAITLEYVELASPRKKWRMYVEPRKEGQ